MKLTTAAETARTRRLVGDEETRLLNAATPHFRALIEAALATGCRLGELLSLRLQVQPDAQGKARYLVLPPEKTKTNQPRLVPVSTRLAAMLEMRRVGPDGQDHQLTAYVFGNEAGEKIARVTTA